MSVLLNNWPAKLAALLLAILAWYLIALGSDEIGQTTLAVPVTVEGLSETQTPIGVPETVLITASGRSNRVTRLRPENFVAVLDLSGVNGAFQREIEVVAPQGITVVRVTPAEASGMVETISSREQPVTVALLTPLPEDEVVQSEVTPSAVVVRGRDSVLERLAAVRAITEAQPGTYQAPLLLLDAEGKPLEGLTSEPAQVTVMITATPVLHQKTVPLAVAPPAVEGFAVEGFTVLPEQLRVVGTAAALEGLEVVRGRVEPVTGPVEALEYTLDVALELPEGVAATESATARFRLAPSNDDTTPSNGPSNGPSDGDVNDLPRTPLR